MHISHDFCGSGGFGSWSVSREIVVRCQPGMQVPEGLTGTGVPTSRLFSPMADKLVLVVATGLCFFVRGPLHISWAWASSQHGHLDSKPNIEKGRGRETALLFLN